MSDALIVSITSFINFLLGGFVLIRNPKNPIHRLFAALSLVLITWTIFNYLADQAVSQNLLFTRLTFASGILIAFSLWQLSNVFPSGKSVVSKKFVVAEIFVAIAVIAFCLTPLLVPSVTKKPDAGVELEVGVFYLPYLLYVLHMLGLLIYNFRRHFRTATKKERAQIKTLLKGIILYAIFAMAFSLLLPLFIDNWSSSRFGPVSTLVFVAFTAYAIVRHRLLDIRFIITRSIAYLLLIGTFTTTYAVLAFGLAERLFPGNLTSQRIISVAVALSFAFSAPYLRKRFDKLTNRLFYRDAYDAQDFIDRLTSILVANTDLTKLLQDSSDLINENLKPSYTKFILFNEDHQLRFIGHMSNVLQEDNARELMEFVAPFDQKVIGTDELSATDHKQLLRFLKNKSIALVVKLTSRDDFMGVLLVGAKRSGNMYSSNDVKVFEIVADELSLAIENGLRYEEIEKFNETLQREVDDATRQLRRTNEKLKALDETKDEFISMASHQLRTPLTSVKGYISMVLEGDAGKLNEQQVKLLNQAFISSQHMNYLISDLLNVSRLRTGKFVIETSPTYLPDVIEGEVQQLMETAQARGLELSFDKPASFPTLELDETKTRQVIMNFIDNAIYYTPKGGHVQVVLEETPQTIEYKVIDDGLGVPRAEQHHLFGKFFRADNAKRARPDGTGLGLFMAKKVVIAQGGAIIFRSTEGKGSTFGFTFPKHGKTVAHEE